MPTLWINTLESYNSEDKVSLLETSTFEFTQIHSTFTAIKLGNYFLVRNVCKVKHTGYISWEDNTCGVLPRELFRWEDFKNKDVLSASKCPSPHQLTVVKWTFSALDRPQKDSCALMSQGVCASEQKPRRLTSHPVTYVPGTFADSCLVFSSIKN